MSNVDHETCALNRGVLRREMTELKEEVEQDQKECAKETKADMVKVVESAVSGVEARIKVWLLTGLALVLSSVVGSTTCAVARMGSYVEKVEHNESRIQRIEDDLDDLKRRLYPANPRHGVD